MENKHQNMDIEEVSDEVPIESLDEEEKKEVFWEIKCVKDGKIFSISHSAAKKSKFFKIYLEEEIKKQQCLTQNNVDEEKFYIYIPNFESKYVEKCVQWLENHKDDTKTFEEEFFLPKPLPKEGLENVRNMNDFDRKLFNLPVEDVTNFLSCANFLNIPMLVEMLCAKLASFFIDKTEKQIMEMLNVTEGDKLMFMAKAK